MYPKAFMDLSGWNIRSFSCGAATFSVTGDKSTITWGGAQYGELAYGPGGKKSSASPDKVHSMEGLTCLMAACGVGQTLFLVDEADPVDKFPARSRPPHAGAVHRPGLPGSIPPLHHSFPGLGAARERARGSCCRGGRGGRRQGRQAQGWGRRQRQRSQEGWSEKKVTRPMKRRGAPWSAVKRLVLAGGLSLKRQAGTSVGDPWEVVLWLRTCFGCYLECRLIKVDVVDAAVVNRIVNSL